MYDIGIIDTCHVCDAIECWKGFHLSVRWLEMLKYCRIWQHSEIVDRIYQKIFWFVRIITDDRSNCTEIFRHIDLFTCLLGQSHNSSNTIKNILNQSLLDHACIYLTSACPNHTHDHMSFSSLSPCHLPYSSWLRFSLLIICKKWLQLKLINTRWTSERAVETHSYKRKW